MLYIIIYHIHSEKKYAFDVFDYKLHGHYNSLKAQSQAKK